MNKRVWLGFASLIAVVPTSLTIVACNAEALCQHQYDCRDELAIKYEDDYVDVCKAEHTGRDNYLRQSAEKECEDLANAEIAYNTCLGTLDCEKLRDEMASPGSDDTCKAAHDTYAEAFAATNAGAECTGIDIAAGGEGEGEGEGEGDAGA